MPKIRATTKRAAKRAPVAPAAPDKRTAAVTAHIESRPGATGSSLPSAPGVTLYKLMGKMFAILSTRKAHYVIVKSDPHFIELLKEQYKGVSHRSHLDKRFWISIDLDSDVPLPEIERLITQSYAQIRESLTRKQKAGLDAS
jgi:predicted DNA-binding protein (MmcQ/YjbR family)